MADTWTELWNGTIGGRPIRIEGYSASGDLRAWTEQKADVPSGLPREESRSVEEPSVCEGPRIKVDAEAKAVLLVKLVSQAYFTAAEATEIVSNIS